MALFDLTTKRCTAVLGILLFTVAAWNATAQTIQAERFYSGAPTFDLLGTGTTAARLREAVRAAAPRMGLEIRATLDVPFDAQSTDGQLRLYAVLLAASTMQGTEYYSASRSQMRLLYQESYTIVSASDRTRVPDHRPTRLEPYRVYHAFQRDGSFGRNVQRVEIWAEGSTFLMATTNETTMFYSFIPLLRPGALRTFIIVEPGATTGQIEVYAHLSAGLGALFGLESRAHQSLYNRVVALISWFEQQVQTNS